MEPSTAPAAVLLTIKFRFLGPKPPRGVSLRPGCKHLNPDLHMFDHQRPTAAGLYDPSFEHDACGIGAVARLDNQREHQIIERALDVLFRLDHRGAVGSEVDTGDGAGILFQVPDEFFRGVVEFDLPDQGRYGVGMAFLTTDAAKRAEAEALVEKVVTDEGQPLLGWRDVPV